MEFQETGFDVRYGVIFTALFSKCLFHPTRLCVLRPLAVADRLNLKSVKQKWPPVNFDTEFWNIRLLMTLGHADRPVISQFGFAHVNQVYWFPALFTIVRLLCRIVFCLNLYATQKMYTVF